MKIKVPTAAERLKHRYKVCKCGREYNISIYQVGPYICPKCSVQKKKKKLLRPNRHAS